MSVSSQLSKEKLLEAYRLMRTIREFEERLHVEFATGEIPGFVHLYAGEEASAVGTMLHLSDVDYVATTHRGHGHCIAKGVDVRGMMAEIYGRRTGVCHGKGGSMHIADRASGFGMPGVIVDGFDFFAVHEALGEAIERARGGGGPTLVEVKLSRYFGHFEGDAQTYRAPGEVQKLRDEKDCLKRFEERVVRAEMLTSDELRGIDATVQKLIEESVVAAKAAPLPTAEDLMSDVYVSYP